MRFRGGEDEFYVGRRFLERFEERIEGCSGEHVDFVDDVNLEMSFARRVADVVAQLADLFDPVVTRAIDFEDIEAITGRDFLAAIANPARADSWSLHTVKCLRQDAGGGGFTDPSRTDKKVGMGEAILLDCILKSAGDMRLADEVVKRLRSIFTSKNLITHRWNLIGSKAGENRNSSANKLNHE